jgi:hypothetical protein
MIVPFVFLFSLFIASTSAFWILDHGPLNLNARLDPIINPNNISGHLHTFVGSNAVSSTQDYNSIRASSACTTSGISADKSSYWAPTLFKYDGGKFTAFNLTTVNTYYLQRGKMTLKAFPAGLRMIAGNATATGPASTTQLQSVVSFVCLNYKSGSSQTSTIPQSACPDGLRAQIIFPSCWDGKNLDSTDHKSHMAYPLGDAPDNGDQCPSTHPVRFTTLFYEFIWSVGSAANNGNWVMANGDQKGYAYHADFMNGWDVSVLQSAIDQCTTNLFNNLEGCPPFKPSLDRTASSNCKVVRSEVKGISSEVVSGYLDKLPGCNTISNGSLKGKGGCNQTELASSSMSIPSSLSSSSSSSSSTLSSVASSSSTSTMHTSTTTKHTIPSTASTTHRKHHHHKHHHHHHHKHNRKQAKHRELAIHEDCTE